MNELPEEERDAYKRQYYRAQFLKDAYLQEEKRLNRIDELKEKSASTKFGTSSTFATRRKIGTPK